MQTMQPFDQYEHTPLTVVHSLKSPIRFVILGLILLFGGIISIIYVLVSKSDSTITTYTYYEELPITLPILHQYVTEHRLNYLMVPQEYTHKGDRLLKSDSYYGESKDNKPHGKGIAIHQNYIIEGIFENGLAVYGAVYRAITHLETEVIVGPILNNQVTGNGWMTWGEGIHYYEGGFESGLKDGDGVMLYNNNWIYQGQWKRNKQEGSGRYIYPDGSQEIGTFDNGFKHGLFKLYDEGGKLKKTMIFDCGNLVKETINE